MEQQTTFRHGTAVDVLIAQPYDWKRNVQPEPKWVPGFTFDRMVASTDDHERCDLLPHAPGHCWRGISMRNVRLAALNAKQVAA